jgi:hypothetical protein
VLSAQPPIIITFLSGQYKMWMPQEQILERTETSVLRKMVGEAETHDAQCDIQKKETG